jgi:hypothetical protein
VKRPRPFAHLSILVAFIIAIALLGCGDNRSLQSVSISPAVANSSAQFTAIGMYNNMPNTVDITATTTWCVGSSSGICAGNIAVEATVNAGLAHCLSGFTGTVTILAGHAEPPPGADVGFQLKPFAAAQLNCP